MKNSLEGFNSRSDQLEEKKMSKLEDSAIEVIQFEKQKKKKN